MASSNTVRVALVQAASVDLDLQGSVEKTCQLITEAAQGGAKLVAFPEVFIPGYPFWVWTRCGDNSMNKQYIRNSLKRGSPEMQRICSVAADQHVEVYLGYSENDNNSLYISQSHIGSDGVIRMTRRKIKPTYVERTVFGEGSGSSLRNVIEVPDIGKVGGLNCWEHSQPLLKFHTFSQGETIHVAAWPPTMPARDDEPMWFCSADGQRNMTRMYAVEGSCFALHCTSVLTEQTIEKLKTNTGTLYNISGGGFSAVYGPDGRKISKDLAPDEEGILYADLDMDLIVESKIYLDSSGHYSRPDLLWVGADLKEKEHVRE